MASEFTTRTRVKQALGIPGAVTRHDAYLDDLVDRVDGRLLAIFGLPTLTRQTFVESYDVPSPKQRAIRLRAVPVVSITTVVDDTTTRAATEYYVEDRDTGWLRLVSMIDEFTIGNQTVDVTYVAGWTTTDAAWQDFERLATGIVAAQFNTEPHGGVRGSDVGGYSYDFDPSSLPAPLQRIVNDYRRATPHTGR